MRKHVLFLSCCAFFCIGVTRAVAQTPAEIELAKEAYLNQADEYRRMESGYFLSRSTYQQLKTLATLEEAIINLKKVQESRILTLQRFFVALRLLVLDTRGLEVQTKSKQIENIDTALKLLDAAAIELAKANDRITLNQQTVVFEKNQKDLNSIAYSALSFIRIARVQSALDQLGLSAQLVYDDIQHRNLSAGEAAQQQRAYDELVRLIQSMKADLLLVRLNAERKELASLNPSSYGETLSGLSNVYTNLRRGYEFIRELQK